MNPLVVTHVQCPLEQFTYLLLSSLKFAVKVFREMLHEDLGRHVHQLAILQERNAAYHLPTENFFVPKVFSVAYDCLYSPKISHSNFPRKHHPEVLVTVLKMQGVVNFLASKPEFMLYST